MVLEKTPLLEDTQASQYEELSYETKANGKVIKSYCGVRSTMVSTSATSDRERKKAYEEPSASSSDDRLPVETDHQHVWRILLNGGFAVKLRVEHFEPEVED